MEEIINNYEWISKLEKNYSVKEKRNIKSKVKIGHVVILSDSFWMLI